MWTQVTIQTPDKTRKKKAWKTGWEKQLAWNEVGIVRASVSVGEPGGGKCEQTGEIPRSRAAKKDRGKERKRDKRKVETYNFSLALCDPRVLIQYREDLAKDPIKASPLLVSLRLGWQTKDHCCCGVYKKNQVGAISC